MTDDAGTLLLSVVDRLATASAREQAALAVALGVRRPDVEALRLLRERNDVSATGLMGDLQLSSGGTSAVVDRLEAAGLLTRERLPAGRRRVWLRLTDAGRAAITEGREPLERDVRALVDECTAAERAALERGLARLADALTRQADRTASRVPAAARDDGPALPPVLWG